MPQWEYCEVAWTPKQIVIHIYSSEGMLYDAIQPSAAWGELLAKLGDDEWEMVAAVPTRPANHTLYYFKRILDPTIREDFELRQATLRAEWEKSEKEKAALRAKWEKFDKQMEEPRTHITENQVQPSDEAPQQE